MVFNAMLNSFPGHVVLNRLVQLYPQHAGKIRTAQVAGYPAHVILRKVSGNRSEEESEERYMTEHEKVQKRDKAQKRKAVVQALGVLGTAGAVAANGYAFATRNQSVRPNQILPALPNQDQPRGPIGSNPQGPIIQGRTAQPNTQLRRLGNSGQPPGIGYTPPASRGPRSNPPSPSQGTIIPPYHHNASKNVSLVRNLGEEQRIGQAVLSGLSIPAIVQALRQTIPKSKLALLERAPGGLDQVLEDYGMVVKKEHALSKFNERNKGVNVNPRESQSLIQQETQRFQQEYPEIGNEETEDVIQDQSQQQFPEQMHQPVQQELQQSNISDQIIKKLQPIQIQTPEKNPKILNKSHNQNVKENLTRITKSKAISSIPELEGMGLEEHESYLKYLKDALKYPTKVNFYNEDQKKEIVDQIKKIENAIRENQSESETLNPEDLRKESLDQIKPKEIQEKIPVNPKVIEVTNNIVVTPLGAAEVQHKGKEGQIVKTELGQKSFIHEDIEEIPEDVIQAVSNILNIPEVDRSSNIALFLYNPKDSEMYFQFHNGEAYKYYGIDPDKVFRLANKMTIPITSGQNIFGAWSPEDKASLGAAFYQEILKDPKYKKSKKGEPPNPNYQKLETMYDYWKDLRKKPKARKSKVRDVE